MDEMTLETSHATPRDAVESWLSAFNAALANHDVERATRLFAATCFWRDLIAFTWNIKTVENQEGVREMLRHTLPHLGRATFSLAGEPTQKDDVVEAWLTLETGIGQGQGHLRLRGGEAWTLLTSLAELTGFEEPAGVRRPLGAEHGTSKARKTWQEKREAEARISGLRNPALRARHRRRSGRHRTRRAGCASLTSRISSSTSMTGPATNGASAINRSACTIRSGTTICPISIFRRTGRSSRPRTRSATGSNSTPR